RGAELGGKVGQFREMFSDPAEPLSSYCDRASEVASLIFYATIDEHGDRTLHVTHRTLAQATMRGIADFYRLDPEEQKKLSGRPDWLSSLIADTADGYAHVTNDVDNVLEALGFHISSGVLADREYRLIDEVMRDKCPDLTNYLRKTPSTIGGKRVPAYSWIYIHGVGNVEDDHADKAFIALYKAASYITNKSEEEIRHRALIGYERFASIQNRFFKNVETDCASVRPG